MTCDPRLLNRLVMEHSGEIPTIPEETSATESLTSNPYRGGVSYDFTFDRLAQR